MIKRILATAACVTALSSAGTAQIERTSAEVTISGRVYSLLGSPVANAAVTVLDSKAATRTDSTGFFRLVHVPSEIVTVNVKHLGFVPANVVVDGSAGTDTLFVQMIAASNTLDTVRITAKTNLLTGIVLDDHNVPVQGALVSLIGGKKIELESGKDGRFNFTVDKPGAIVFRVRKEGFASLTESIRLEGERGVVLHLEKPSSRLTNIQRLDADGFNNRMVFVWQETDHRMAVKTTRAAIVPREELAALGSMPLGNAIRYTKSGRFAANFLTDKGNTACVLLDGHRPMGLMSLDVYKASDVEFVELYPPGTDLSGSVASYLDITLCDDPLAKKKTEPYYAVVWTRYLTS